jgi:hypothetical protein
MGITAAGTMDRILGTTSVHNISPAWVVIILLVMGKAKTLVRIWSRRFDFRYNQNQVPGLREVGTDSGSEPLSIIYITGGGGIAWERSGRARL